VPIVDAGFSTYFKVGKSGGIDIPFCLVSCHRIPESQFTELTDEKRRQILASWSFPESAGLTNAVRWNVNLGAGFTASRWIAMPSYKPRELQLPQSVRSGHQHRIWLIKHDQSASEAGNHRESGVELRILLEPLESPPVRTRPNEIDHTSYISGTGLFHPMEETLKILKHLPSTP
jgi:hypothetical protein